MKIEFKNKKLKKHCETSKDLSKKYGLENARKIVQRINELQAAETLAELPPATGIHPLTADRKGQFAVKVKQPYRLVFEPTGEYDLLHPDTIRSIKILEIEDYH